MVHRLRGMFAFAIWDAKKNGLFLARDPYGIKPLYYADTGRSLFVASQVKALSSGGAEIGGVNPAGHVGFFLLGYVPEPHTLHAAVKALPAGTSLWCDSNGQRKINKYFDLSEKLAQKTPDLSWQETQEVLASSLRDSMRHHLVADVPVGVFLSAGLDSATVAALATERSGASLESMTLRFDEFAGDQKDEAPLAEEIARLYGTRHQIRTVKGSDFKHDFEKLTAAMDQPSVDGVNTYFVAKEAAAMGLKVALSGVGGDELFGGYNTFHQVPTLVKSLGWIPGISGIGATLRIISAPLIAQFTSPKYASLLEYSGDYAAAYFLRRGLFMPWELPDILDPEMVREGWRELNMLEDMAAATWRIDTDRHKVAALENQWYLRNQLLRDADWAGMAHSLEIRTPLVDAELFATVGRLAVGKQLNPIRTTANVVAGGRRGWEQGDLGWVVVQHRERAGTRFAQPPQREKIRLQVTWIDRPIPPVESNFAIRVEMPEHVLSPAVRGQQIPLNAFSPHERNCPPRDAGRTFAAAYGNSPRSHALPPKSHDRRGPKAAKNYQRCSDRDPPPLATRRTGKLLADSAKHPSQCIGNWTPAKDEQYDGEQGNMPDVADRLLGHDRTD